MLGKVTAGIQGIKTRLHFSRPIGSANPANRQQNAVSARTRTPIPQGCFLSDLTRFGWARHDWRQRFAAGLASGHTSQDAALSGFREGMQVMSAVADADCEKNGVVVRI